MAYSGKYVLGDEETVDDCVAYSRDKDKSCESETEFAAVVCNDDLPDLMPDVELLESSVYLHDQPLFYLQCAMEENCMARTAYEQVTGIIFLKT